MRFTTLLAVLLPALALSGCIQSTALIKVGADGRGTIEIQSLMSSSALAQVRQMAGAFGGGANGKSLDVFSEEQAKAIAEKMGEGVSLVSSMPLRTASSEGRASIYAFTDITKIRVNQTPSVPGNASGRAGGVAVGGSQAGNSVGIALARTPEGTAVLTLHTPGDPLSTVVGQLGGMTRPGSSIPTEQMEMLRPALGGLRVALRVEPTGRLIRTNSAFSDGRTVTLFDVDLDALATDDEAFGRFMHATTPGEMAEALKKVPGVKVNTEHDITIEFAP